MELLLVTFAEPPAELEMELMIIVDSPEPLSTGVENVPVLPFIVNVAIWFDILFAPVMLKLTLNVPEPSVDEAREMSVDAPLTNVPTAWIEKLERSGKEILVPSGLFMQPVLVLNAKNNATKHNINDFFIT